jgi:glyoxylase-like metal-dependent hydrolase (beta-lactamase superfamily II)
MTGKGFTLQVGDAVMRPIFEIDEIRMPFETFLDNTTADEIRRCAQSLMPHYIDPESYACRLSQHAWLIEANGSRIVVDPCVGHQRHRPALPFYHQISSPLLDNLRNVGVQPEDVDFVFCTHLHLDHVGWNTRLDDGRYVPTFPNARYLFSAAEEAYWRRDLTGELSEEDAYYNGGVFVECILPIQQAGLAQLAKAGTRIAECLTIIDTPGHTIGHLAGLLESRGEGAVLAGDAIHHPLQVVFHDRPSHAYDVAQAHASRIKLLELCADKGYWLAPAHFRAPHVCRIAKENGRFRLQWHSSQAA